MGGLNAINAVNGANGSQGSGQGIGGCQSFGSKGLSGVAGVSGHGHHHHPPISPRKGPSKMHDMQWNKAMQAERSLGATSEDTAPQGNRPMEVVEGAFHPNGTNSRSIPPFYPYTKDVLRFAEERVNSRILEFLRPFGEGLPLVALKTLLRELFGLPVSLGFALHRKLASLSENVIPVQKLLDWMERTDFARSTAEKRFFDVLKGEEGDWITHEDLRPVILGIIVSHPGLVFLKVRIVVWCVCRSSHCFDVEFGGYDCDEESKIVVVWGRGCVAH